MKAALTRVSDDLSAVARSFPAVVDALLVDTSLPASGGCAFLFVVLRPGRALDGTTQAGLHGACLLACGDVPDAVYAVADLPRAADGRHLPGAVRRLLMGEPAPHVAAEEPVANPASLEFFAWLSGNL